MHAEHRGRTAKCPISNHKVDYSYSKLVTGIRISMDKSSSLTECPLEFEIVQEFALAEKITLGYVKLNLAEYIEESESFGREVGSPPRKRSSIGVNPAALAENGDEPDQRIVEEGIVRRYLMSDSKINSTLKIGILMVQVDGERNFIAPPLRTAPVFGGIAGLVAPEAEDDISRMYNNPVPQTMPPVLTNCSQPFLIYPSPEMPLKCKISTGEPSQPLGPDSLMSSRPTSASRTFSPVGMGGGQRRIPKPTVRATKRREITWVAPFDPATSAGSPTTSAVTAEVMAAIVVRIVPLVIRVCLQSPEEAAVAAAVIGVISA
jgi:hypothetical protein